VCFAAGRGLASLVVIHKHSPPNLGGGREKKERRRGKKRERSKELKSRTENRNDKHH